MIIVTLMFDLEGAERPHNYFLEKTIKKIRNVLNNHSAKAVFNTTGVIVEKYPKMIETLHSEGHEIANHSYNHEVFTQLSDEDLFESIYKTESAIEKVIDVKPSGFRSPRLAHDYRLYPLLSKMDYKWTSNKYHRFIESSQLRKLGFYRQIKSRFRARNYPTKPYWVDGVLEIPLLSSMDGELLGWLPPTQTSPIEKIDYTISSYMKQFYRSKEFFNLNFHPWIIGTGNRLQILSDILKNLNQMSVKLELAQNIAL